jgi:hypothetical protein
MTAADPMRSKALACLREGRVTVYGIKLDDAWRPTVVLARVLSSRDRHPYLVRFHDSAWSCSCRDGLRGDRCPHVTAVQLVTTAAVAA